MKNIVIGITGASGIDYARNLVKELYKTDHKIFLIITDPGKLVMEKELNFMLKGDFFDQQKQLKNFFEIPLREDNRFILMDNKDIAASVASGSFKIDAMVVVPCSMATVSGIARGSSRDLLERAADVAIKEGRKLILVPRETPLSSIHLQNLLSLSQMGVTILPAMPAFYHKPYNIEDLLNFITGRIMENLEIEHDLYNSWGEVKDRIGKDKEFKYSIGILQLTSHLDDAVEGFKEGISSFKDAEIHYDYRNVEGKVPLLADEAGELVSRGVDLMFACTTPAAKAGAGAGEGQGIPVVFTPVLDPVKVGLVAGWESSENHLTGVSGLVSSELKLARFKEIYPRLRKLVIIYEEGNPNTAIELDYVLAAAAGMGLKIETLPVRQSGDIKDLARKRLSSGDGIFVPISPVVEQNISLLISTAREKKVPLIVPDETGVRKGALLGLYASHYDLGVSAGYMAAEILQGREPSDIPIGRPEQPRLAINLNTARYLGLDVSTKFLEQATVIY